MTIISPETLCAGITAALESSSTSPENAASVARALTLAEIDGKKGHGLSRVPSYAGQAKSGKVQGMVSPSFSMPKPGVLAIDAGHGFAYPAFDLMLDELPKMASSQGIAMAGIYRSHHYGVAGHHVEKAADQGMVALLFGNTPAAMAPWGGKTGLFGDLESCARQYHGGGATRRGYPRRLGARCHGATHHRCEICARGDDGAAG
jgi:(2R)-3-sulfolactate dehydrogenase (NADP+)